MICLEKLQNFLLTRHFPFFVIEVKYIVPTVPYLNVGKSFTALVLAASIVRDLLSLVIISGKACFPH